MSSKNKVFLLILILINVLVLCADKPDWIDNVRVAYPDEYYLAAVGYGPSISIAEEKARANLASIIKVNIDATMAVNDRYEEFENEENYQSEITNDITTSTKIENFLNVEIGKKYMDEDAGIAYVVAFLQRDKTLEIISSKLKQIESQMNHYIEKANNSKSSLDKYANYNIATIFVSKYREYFDQYNTISNGNTDDLLSNNELQKIISTSRELAKDITFNINIRNDQDGIISSGIYEIITDMGFSIVNDNALFFIKGNIVWNEVTHSRYKAVHYIFSLEIEDEKGNIVVSKMIKRRANSKDSYEGAKSVARKFIIKKLSSNGDDNLLNKLNNYFDNLCK